MNEEWSATKVLVTGGSQGIGLGIAETFAAAGAAVTIAGRNAEKLDAAVSTLRERGLDATALVADVSDPQSCRSMAAAARDAMGGIDVLCANAGIFPIERLGELSPETVAETFATNVYGTIFSIQACTDALTRSERGRIVVTSSITGVHTGFPGLSHYGASKAAQVGFIRSAALELSEHGITVNAVLPGSIWTEGLDGLSDDIVNGMKAAVPQKRLGSVTDIGNAALYFASRGASFVTGQCLVVDGGQTLPEVPGLV